MATEVLRMGKLYVTFDDFERTPDSNVPGIDELSVTATIENSNRPLGESGRAPEVELRDDSGGIYEPVNLDGGWYMPEEPDSTRQATLRFRLPESATNLELVLAPDTDEEAHVLLESAFG